MALKIVWSPLAQQKRKEILQYWIDNNNSKSYRRKLNFLFKEALKLLSTYPQIGRSTDIKNVRVKIVRDYLIFNEIHDKHLLVLIIWDSRQNPEKLDVPN
ncbi:MAG: plasmid stabilization system protein ParE [Cyclobacteriaceae bacterium]|jgi:toxin YoeB